MDRDKTPETQSERPEYLTREQCAAIFAERYGAPISSRTLERWPLAWRTVNRRAVTTKREFLAEAERRLNAAPVIMGGSQTKKAA